MLPQSRPHLTPSSTWINHHRRSIWWWSRRSNDWGDHFDRAIERQLRRQQRLQQHIYIKKARRRAFWENDTVHDDLHSLWPWTGPRWAKRLCVDSSFTTSKTDPRERQNKAQQSEQMSKGPAHGRPKLQYNKWHKMNEEFEALKRQIDEDPYGAVFGRPPSPQPKSSFLDWFLGPQEDAVMSKPEKENRVVKAEPIVQSSQANMHPRTSTQSNPDADRQSPSTKMDSSRDVVEDEYEYDPITMRNVRKSNTGQISNDGAIEIPVKTFVMKNPDIPETSPSNSMQEIPDSIGKVNHQDESISSSPEPKAHATTTHSHDSDALFSGTAYENSQRIRKLSQIDQRPSYATGSSWLAKEGFVQGDVSSISKDSANRFERMTRITPALDRLNAVKSSSSPPNTSSEKVSDTNFIADKRPAQVESKREHLEKEYSSHTPEDESFLSDVAAIKSSIREGQRQVLSKNALSQENDHVEMIEQVPDPTLPRLRSSTSTPPDMIKEQDEARARTLELQQAAAAVNERERSIRFRDMKIAKTLKDIYEDHYGEINEHHRQETIHSMVPPNTTEQQESTANADTILVAPPATEEADVKAPSIAQEKATVQTSNIEHPPNSFATKLADISLATTKLELFVARANVIVQKSRLRMMPTHQQEETLQDPKPTSYKVLAYDPVTKKVNEAETSSSMVDPNDKTAHPMEILSRLHHAARFLPYFQYLQREGYEVVSGGRDTLIFKKVRDSLPRDDTEYAGEPARDDGPIEEPARNRNTHSSKSSGQRVRRQEQVFSGSRQKQNPKKAEAQEVFFETTKRVILGGALTAAFCYLIGVATEIARGDMEPPKATQRPGIYSTMDSR